MMGTSRLFKFHMLAGFLFLSSTVWAATPASYCYLEANDSQAKMEGLRPDERLPIASVSKIITTYWALSVMKPEDRFSTRIFINLIATDSKGVKTVDIHFAGSRDPYFGKESIHYLASELNKMGIYRIRTLSFDERFKFFWNVGGGRILNIRGWKVETGYFGPDSPTPKQIVSELSRVKSNLTLGYDLTRTQLKEFNINLKPKAQLKALNIKYIPSTEFTPDQSTTVRTISSSPLIMLLKEMNRNSNNHAANQIFEHLGGVDRFREFMRSKGFYEADIQFVNGHGNRKDLENGKSVYNEASCSTILKVMVALRNKLKKYGKDLDDVLPVPRSEEKSTLDSYDNDDYAESLAAKTGTINPAVTLAGMLLTKKGPIFFMYNMSTKGTYADWRVARRKIALQLVELTKKFNGGMPFDTHQVKFVAFEPEMFFQKDDWTGDSEGPIPRTAGHSSSPLAVNSPTALVKP